MNRTAALCAGLIFATILAVLATKGFAQASHPADSPRMQQLHQDPRFEPALKLKGMLLEQRGSTGEAMVVYEAALKLNPNDADLLLKAGIYKLQSGQKEEALQACFMSAGCNRPVVKSSITSPKPIT
jgi:tetratricopeptide (TPR) repeat protein